MKKCKKCHQKANPLIKLGNACQHPFGTSCYHRHNIVNDEIVEYIKKTYIERAEKILREAIENSINHTIDQEEWIKHFAQVLFQLHIEACEEVIGEDEIEDYETFTNNVRAEQREKLEK